MQLSIKQLLPTTHQLKVVLLFVVEKVAIAVHRLTELSSGQAVFAAVVAMTLSARQGTAMTAGMLTCVKASVHHAQQQCAANDSKSSAKTTDQVTAEATELVS